MSSVESGTAPLVARILRGDAAAEAELVTRFGPGLRLLCRHLTRDHDRAGDLEQETLRVVLEKVRRGDLREPDKLAAFLRATARNLFLAERRKQARYTELDDATIIRQSRGPAGAPRAVDALIRAEEAALVRGLLAELRFERDRQLLERYYLSEDSSQRICRDLAIEPARLNRVLYRARQRLRELALRAGKRQRFAGAVAEDLSRHSPPSVHMGSEG